MKVAVVFILLFATVLCRPARKVSLSSEESSEEVLRRQAARKQTALVPQTRAALVQAPDSASDESAESSEQGAAVVPDPTPTSDTTDSQDSEDDDDDDETEEEDEDDSSDSSESGETSSPAPITVSPTAFTEEPLFETTEDPILPTIVIDTETARGDNLGRYSSDYKSIIYVEDKSYNKLPSPYKSWEYVSTGKKQAYDMIHGNDVEKSLPVYKVQALQVHSDILEEDTSTPEMESQGLDATQDQEISLRQASIPGEEGNISASAQQEEEDESTSASSDSTSTESQDEESSEEATATPGAADSDSDESEENDSDEEGATPAATTDMPMVITAK